MSEGQATNLESPNIISLLAGQFSGTPMEHLLHSWENVIFSLITIGMVGVGVGLASRKISPIPGRLQGSLELLVDGLDRLFGEILGTHGKKFIPLAGTLFIYILGMNLLGLIPLLNCYVIQGCTFYQGFCTLELTYVVLVVS